MWSIREWYKWLGDLPWTLKWFPILVLLRPIIDNLYFLKEVSPFLSPLYIVGALTPLLCIVAIVRYSSAPSTRGDQLFSAWSVMLFAACMLLFFREPLSLQTAEFILKLTMPVYLFFFLRRLIRSRRDLQGVLMSFWLSAIPVALLLLYEVFIQPVAIQESRGMERIQGSFGDVVSYGSYITFAVIIACYSLLSNSSKKFNLSWPWVFTIGLGLLGLLNIHHLASYAVVACLLVYFVLIVLKYRSELGWALLLVIAIGVVYFGEDPLRDRIIPLLETDFRVYRGEVGSEKLLHGRIGRWQEMAHIFTSTCRSFASLLPLGWMPGRRTSPSPSTPSSSPRFSPDTTSSTPRRFTIRARTSVGLGSGPRPPSSRSSPSGSRFRKQGDDSWFLRSFLNRAAAGPNRRGLSQRPASTPRPC